MRYAGRVIRQMRAEHGWSLKDLELRSGVSRGQLSRFERGKAKPMPKTVRKLAAAFNTTPEAMYESGEEIARLLRLDFSKSRKESSTNKNNS